jgi:DNA-binding HxlR family transcriptional regulator
MAAMDLLGRRWALRILWELSAGPCTFRVLQDRCDGVSPASLNARLGELRASGLVDTGTAGYQVTAIGAGLAAALAPLSAWAERWAKAAGAG